MGSLNLEYNQHLCIATNLDYLGINKFFNIIDRKKDIDNMMFSNKESNGK